MKIGNNGDAADLQKILPDSSGIALSGAGPTITNIRVDIIGDGYDIDPNKGLVEPLAIVRVETDAGITGYAESFRVPPGVARAVMEGKDSFFGKALIGTQVLHPELTWQQLYDSLMHLNRRGWAVMCLGAIDIALWDIYGKVINQPVFKLLGGAQRSYYQTPESESEIEVVPYCTIVSPEWDNDRMVEVQVEQCIRLKDLKYRAMKLEPLMSTPARIIELATKARKAIGPEVMLAVDIGYRFSDVPSALRVCQALEELDIYFLETPFPVDFYEPYEKLAGQTSIPIAMGEHAVTRAECINMVRYGGVSVVQPYMNTVGGITEAKRVVDVVKDAGGLVIPGNWSTQILGAASIHLAAYSPVTPYIEHVPAEAYESPLRKRLESTGFSVREGVFKLPETPGIGVQLTEDIIEEFKLEE